MTEDDKNRGTTSIYSFPHSKEPQQVQQEPNPMRGNGRTRHTLLLPADREVQAAAPGGNFTDGALPLTPNGGSLPSGHADYFFPSSQ